MFAVCTNRRYTVYTSLAVHFQCVLFFFFVLQLNDALHKSEPLVYQMPKIILCLYLCLKYQMKYTDDKLWHWCASDSFGELRNSGCCFQT